MKRKLNYLSSVLIYFFFIFVWTAPVQGGGNQITRICLTLTPAPQESQAVTWWSDDKVLEPVVQFIRTDQFIQSTGRFSNTAAIQNQVELLHGKSVYSFQAVMPSLDDDTWYTYRVGSDGNWSEWNQFKTASREPDDFTFLFFGDIQNKIFSDCAQVFRAAFRNLEGASFFLLAGDLVNDGQDESQWQEFFNALGWLPRSYPIVPVPGNHEYPNPRFTPFKDRKLTRFWPANFLVPQNGPAQLKGSSHYFIYQNVVFVILNGNEHLDLQAEWMSGILAENKGKRTVIAIHQPMYSTSEKRNDKRFQKTFVPVFDRFNVDLVLQGHDHAYSRTFPLKNHQRVKDDQKGTVYLMSVAGPKTYPVDDRYQHLFARTASNIQWFQTVEVTADKIKIKAYNLDGKIEDEFEIPTPDESQEVSPAGVSGSRLTALRLHL